MLRIELTDCAEGLVLVAECLLTLIAENESEAVLHVVLPRYRGTIGKRCCVLIHHINRKLPVGVVRETSPGTTEFIIDVPHLLSVFFVGQYSFQVLQTIPLIQICVGRHVDRTHSSTILVLIPDGAIPGRKKRLNVVEGGPCRSVHRA